MATICLTYNRFIETNESIYEINAKIKDPENNGFFFVEMEHIYYPGTDVDQKTVYKDVLINNIHVIDVRE